MQPRGMSTVRSVKLFCLAPRIVSCFFSSGSARSFGIGILLRPERYAAVMLFLAERRSFSVPLAMTSPPSLPAPTPMSTNQSAWRNVASSCSTTRSVFPNSVNSLRVSRRRSLSLGCKPIEGSSRTYITPVNRVPICVARRILCDSPPESVLARRSSVR